MTKTHEALPLATPEPLITKGNASGFLCPILRFAKRVERNKVRPCCENSHKELAERPTRVNPRTKQGRAAGRRPRAGSPLIVGKYEYQPGKLSCHGENAQHWHWKQMGDTEWAMSRRAESVRKGSCAGWGRR